MRRGFASSIHPELRAAGSGLRSIGSASGPVVKSSGLIHLPAFRARVPTRTASRSHSQLTRGGGALRPSLVDRNYLTSVRHTALRAGGDVASWLPSVGWPAQMCARWAVSRIGGAVVCAARCAAGRVSPGAPAAAAVDAWAVADTYHHRLVCLGFELNASTSRALTTTGCLASPGDA
jgi:hypothetical protein